MRVHGLTRTEMYLQALKYILKENPKFEISLEKLKEYENDYKKYEKERFKIYSKINEYLNKHYLMYALDYTAPCDNGSREEVIFIVKKLKDNYCEDYMLYHPDFTKDIKACFYRHYGWQGDK